MLYEPVGYIVEYEISALVFLVMIMARYFGTRRFPNQKNRLFSLILWVTLVDMILDVASSFIIDNVFLVPIPITFIVNTAFYFLQIIMPLLMTMYTLAMVERLNRQMKRQLFILFIPGIALLLMLLSNPLTLWFFYVDAVKGYVHGSMFILTYIVCLFYMVITFLAAFYNKKRLKTDEYKTVYRFLGVVFVSMAIQYIYPALLISGVAIAISVILMYFTIQNPDSMLDVTTGAFTYEAMLTFLHDRAQENERVRIVAVKIHNMSRINELLGIENGSLLLRQICALMRESANGSWVFRMRDDCLVAITRNDIDYHFLNARFDSRINQPWVVNDIEILLQANVCCVATSALSEDPISSEEAVNYLNMALTRGDYSGKLINNVTVGAALWSELKRSRAVESALREAIANDTGLELYFQPLWSVKKKRFTNAEALLRFNHPVMGFIPPDEFVPIAESNGFITAMDELVVRKACEFIGDGGSFEGLGLETLEINLSALEFVNSRLPELLGDIMRRYRVNPRFICFEITETAATESFELLKKCMLDMTGKGSRFALDDFGTGYANISQVIQLPFSMVKLDRSLLFGPEVVFENMVRMFNRIERLTVIEGVETSAQAELAESVHADYIQGYYYAKPMCKHDFIKFMKENTETESSPEKKCV